MGNGTLDPRSLTSEERAWCDAIAVALCSSGNYSAAGAISEAVTLGLPERRALFGEPASEGGKVECPNCREQVGPGWDHEACNEQFTCKPAQPESAKVECPNCHHEDTGHAWKVNGELRYSCKGWNKPAQPEHLFTCRNCGKGYDCDEGEHYIFASGLYACLPPKPAQPEPVAEEMPEAVSVNTWQLEELLKYADLAEVSLRTGFHPLEFLFEPADRSLRQCIDAIKEQRDQWRVHAARPARAVAMTEELERVLDAAEAHSGWHMDQGRPESFDEIDAAIAAVRSQAAEAVDASAIYDKGFADGIALQKKCAAEAGKVPDCVIHAVRLRRSYLCDLPNSDYGKEQALEMRTIEDWLRAAEGRK